MATSKNEPEALPAGELSKSSDEAAAPKDSWVQCDSCNKWRRIPAAVADQLDENVPWHCQDNPNSAFASCSIPQELSNEEIDQQEEEEHVSKNRSCHAWHPEWEAFRLVRQHITLAWRTILPKFVFQVQYSLQVFCCLESCMPRPYLLTYACVAGAEQPGPWPYAGGDPDAQGQCVCASEAQGAG